MKRRGQCDGDRVFGVFDLGEPRETGVPDRLGWGEGEGVRGWPNGGQGLLGTAEVVGTQSVEFDGLASGEQELADRQAASCVRTRVMSISMRQG
ncbi:hypothetical protein [Frankia sp. Cj3]|uniref:hypothetical protein n=1 Tax=Frankia sp. Cj3 TaxID=2880976 RepID=UPI001EF71669|nr:hypothetical protein [Frankia sp. Cj3]